MTGADEGAITPDLVLWAARRIVDQHTSPSPATLSRAAAEPGCPQCTERGCAMLAWAHEAIRGLRPRPDATAP